MKSLTIKTPIVLHNAPPATLSCNISLAISARFETEMEYLKGFQLLGYAELEMLEPYRGEMKSMHLLSVLEKINQHSVYKGTQIVWHTAYDCRRKDPLGLNYIGELDFDLPGFDSELKNNDWLEELLQ